MYTPTVTNIALFRDHMENKNLTDGFSINDHLEENSGVIEVFWEFPGKELPDIVITVKNALKGVLEQAQLSGAIYSGTINLVSYEDNNPDEENQYVCFVDSNKLPVPFLEAVGTSPSVPTKAKRSSAPVQMLSITSEDLNRKYREIWAEAYNLGVEDQKTSASMPGVAGCFCDSSPCVCFIPPARVNPYG